MTTPADIIAADRGSVMMITPATPAARRWIVENVDVPAFMHWGDAIACEYRFAPDLLAGAAADGLRVEVTPPTT